jgi:selenide,water dikinase
MTDVTGFGLLGHLVEMCEGARLNASVDIQAVPMLSEERLRHYHEEGCVPGGSRRNWASYGKHVASIDGFERDLMCDPQTSGGLLVSVGEAGVEQVVNVLKKEGLPYDSIGRMGNGQGSADAGSLISFR